jgi:hypothetical protein
MLEKIKSVLGKLGWLHWVGILVAGAAATAVEKGIPHAAWLATAAALFTRLDKLISDKK